MPVDTSRPAAGEVASPATAPETVASGRGSPSASPIQLVQQRQCALRVAACRAGLEAHASIVVGERDPRYAATPETDLAESRS